VGDTVLLDDGVLQLKVLEKQGTEIRCRVMVGGILTEGLGLAVPGMLNSAPFVTEALRRSIGFAVKQQPDWLALSFVSSADEVNSVRTRLHQHGVDIPIIAKIERGAAVGEFDGILMVSDGIMVARGDLGVDIPLERVPLVQKEIIKKCNQAGTPVVTPRRCWNR
jgi:pyruvate kinase